MFDKNIIQMFNLLTHSRKNVIVFVAQKMWLLFVAEIGADRRAREGKGEQEKMEELTVELSVLVVLYVSAF